MSLAPTLSFLENAGIVNIPANAAEGTYLFRQALFRDLAYQSLVRQDRKRLHLTVAEVLEENDPERQDELAPILAEHFYQAGENRRSIFYFALAGNLAHLKNANAEAVNHYTRAIELLIDLFNSDPIYWETGPVEMLTTIFVNRGRALRLTSQFEAANTNYLDMKSLAQLHENSDMELAYLMEHSSLYSTPTPIFDPDRGNLLAIKALELAKSIGNRMAEARVLWNQMTNRFFANNFDDAQLFGEQALSLARSIGLQTQLAVTLNDIVRYVYIPTLQFEAALSAIAEARTQLSKHEHQAFLADNFVNESIVYINMGEFQKSLDAASKAIEISQQIGNLWVQSYALVVSGNVYLESGQIDLAITALDESFRLSELSGFVAGRTITSSLLALLYGNLGAVGQGLAFAYFATGTADRQALFWEAQANASLALLLISNGNLDQAEGLIRKNQTTDDRHSLSFYSNYLSIAEIELALAREDYEWVVQKTQSILDILSKQNAKGMVPYYLYYQGVALMKIDQPEKAELILSEAVNRAEQIGSRRPWWKALCVLASLSEIHGDNASARKYRDKAKEVVGFIINHSGIQGLQDSFSNLPEIQNILSN